MVLQLERMNWLFLIVLESRILVSVTMLFRLALEFDRAHKSAYWQIGRRSPVYWSCIAKAEQGRFSNTSSVFFEMARLRARAAFGLGCDVVQEVFDDWSLLCIVSLG